MDIKQKNSILYMLLWSFSFVLGMTCAKFLTKGLSSIVIGTIRYIMSTLIIVGIVLGQSMYQKYRLEKTHTNAPLDLWKTQCLRIFSTCKPSWNLWWVHWARIFFIVGSTILMYYGYRNLSFGVATCIGLTTPLFTMVLSIFILGEQFQWRRSLALIIGYAGVIFIANPSGMVFNKAVLIQVGANIFSACAILCTRILSKSENSLFILILTQISCMSVFFLITLLMGGISSHSISSLDLILLLIIGGLMSFSQFCYIKALAYQEASFVTLFEYLKLPLSIGIGYFFFSELLNFKEMIGIGLIVMSIGIISVYDPKNC